ncbi:MAG TPA: DciA family protein [Burkholderiales bacterium]|nr:DciA family protein [Burkholderiales bacterium]
MSAQKIGMLLGTADFKPLVEKARRLMGLQTRYAACAPPSLAKASRVTAYRSGTLFLTADNAAAAAKLRQLAPRLLKLLNEQEPQVTAIRIRVQPVNPPEPKHSAHPHGLPPRALQHFQALASNVADSPLKNALANLVRHHRKRRQSGA